MEAHELTQRIIEKKFAQLSVADGAAILNSFTSGYATSSSISEASIKSLLELHLIRKTSPYHYVLTNFGQLVKKKLEPCPF
jgi:hypothetical protein